MLFNSYDFCLFFFPTVLGIYFFLNKHRLSSGLWWLFLTSLFFYGYWNPVYIPLILGSIIFNYLLGSSITKLTNENNRAGYNDPIFINPKRLLIIGIAGNLAVLGFFKYFDFFITNLNQIPGINFTLLRVVLPLGISFFTFTQIAYLVDSYQGLITKHDLLKYSLFVSYFPHLLAGPIIHYRDMATQFEDVRKKKLNWENTARGLTLFAIGLFKKVMIADTFAQWAAPGFAADYLKMMEAWAAVLSFTFQIYFDFSGYTDMALGLSLMLNINLPQNFNSPYQANSIIDFWRRWHQTLSKFLKDYIYIPLGGNRKGKLRRYVNLMATMLLGGLWHGAAWTYVFWGAWHGILLIINHLWRDFGFKMHRFYGRILTFGAVAVSWVFFKAADFKQAFTVLNGLINWKDTGLDSVNTVIMPWGRKEIIVLFIFMILVFVSKNSTEIVNNLRFNRRWAIMIGLMLLISILNFTKTSTFLYYQF